MLTYLDSSMVAALHHDLGPDGAVTTLVWPQPEAERVALDVVTEYGIRALDALHVAAAHLAGRAPADGAPVGFATLDADQAAVATVYDVVLR